MLFVHNPVPAIVLRPRHPRLSPPGCSPALLMKFVEVVIDITGEQAEQDWQVWIDIARKSS
jgi:hypothetical protein